MLNRLKEATLPANTRQYREETADRISWGHWFALFNIILAILIASRYAFNADWPNTLSGKLYFFISLFGHFSFVVFAFYLLLLFPLSFVIKNVRGFRAFSVIFATLGQTLLLLDTEVFKQFYLHLSPLVWDLLVNPDNGELARQWQLLFVPMPLILLMEMLYSRWCWQKLRSFNRQTWGKYVASFFLSCFVATHLIYAWADTNLNRPIASQKANYPLSYPMTARSFLEKHGLIDIEELEQQAENMGRVDSFYLNYPKQAIEVTKSAKVNLLLVNISGLAPEKINTQLMPSLKAISLNSHEFANHYAAADNPTASTLGLFYSLSGKYLDSVLSEKTASPLIEVFQKEQYQFGLFSYNSFKAPIYQRAMLKEFKLPKTTGNESTLNAWYKWFVQRDITKPFFSYLELTASENLTDLDQKLFNQIWQELTDQGTLKNTLVVITSDLAPSEQLKNDFSQAHIRVPFIVYWQGDAKKYHQLSSHLDFMPTILRQFFGVTTPIKSYAQGVDLSEANERVFILATNLDWNVAILPDGEQYHLNRKGKFEKFNAQGEKEKVERPPLPIFLQLIKQSNQFIEK